MSAEAEHPRAEKYRGRKLCPTQHKRRYSSAHFAEIGARELHRNLNRNGELAEDTYGYVCPGCKSWHLTRRPEWNGRPMRLLHRAAPEHLQRWAMGQ